MWLILTPMSLFPFLFYPNDHIHLHHEVFSFTSCVLSSVDTRVTVSGGPRPRPVGQPRRNPARERRLVFLLVRIWARGRVRLFGRRVRRSRAGRRASRLWGSTRRKSRTAPGSDDGGRVWRGEGSGGSQLQFGRWLGRREQGQEEQKERQEQEEDEEGEGEEEEGGDQGEEAAGLPSPPTVCSVHCPRREWVLLGSP